VSRRAPRPTLVLTVPSRTEFLGLVREVTRLFGELVGFERGQAEKLALAVDEAATNVIEHAYRGAGDREVEVRYDDGGADLVIELLDDGAPVDPRDVPSVDLRRYASERRTGGLGMHLMGQIMDSVTFRRRARRNVCSLVKRKPARTMA
jgi:anti-sigma regulatory factor (Ser/Thr protein kinase)